MPAIAIFDAESNRWLSARETVSPEGQARLSAKELDEGFLRVQHPGDDEHLNLFEGKLGPDTEVKVHAHRTDEIIYVAGGEMVIGRRVLTVGSSVYIPAMTLYQFKSGAEGLHFLNFRASRDTSYFSKDDFLAERG